MAVAVAGLGGYMLARRALDPIERMTEHARTITAERLSDRLPVDNPEDEMGRLATVFNETLGRLEASFEQMRRFTADVSHELRTPLTAIRTVGEVGLRDKRSDEAYRGIIGSMLEEVDRLSGLVDRLLVLSRAETGHAKLAVEAVDLRELAENVVAHLGVLAEEKQQSIRIDASGTPRCFGDRVMLRQALINLVDNAIKYSPVGGQISIRASESAAGAVLDVSDNGPGIGAESPSLIFDRYYREHRTASGEVGGAGLGLSIAKWVVEVNGGELSLERGNGTGLHVSNDTSGHETLIVRIVRIVRNVRIVRIVRIETSERPERSERSERRRTFRTTRTFRTIRTSVLLQSSSPSRTPWPQSAAVSTRPASSPTYLQNRSSGRNRDCRRLSCRIAGAGTHWLGRLGDFASHARGPGRC